MFRSLGSLLLAFALCALPDAPRAAPVLRHQLFVNGDFALFGNTLAYDCAAGAPPLVGTVGACGDVWADTGVDVFWVSSPGTASAVASTANAAAAARSTAVLSLPPRAVVRYARVYWAAQSPTAAYDGAALLTTPDGATAALTADHGVAITVGEGEHWYQSSADVTALLQALAEPRGPYTVSGVDSIELAGLLSETAFAAWWAVVFYEDPDDPALRQLTLFDGLDYVEPIAPADVTFGGFLVPTGGFEAKLGVVTYEGDGGYAGDQLAFRGYRSVDPEPSVLTTLADAMNEAANFFNGTRSWLGVPRTVEGDLPQASGAAESMMSFDLDVVDVKALGAVHPGDDSARIRATSSVDVYALGAFITSLTTLRPSFAATVKSATNLSRPDGVFAGDLVEFAVSTANHGNDPSVETVLEDRLPAGVTYVPGSLEIVSGANAGAKTDAAGDDQAEYDPSARRIVFRLGTGADAVTGGRMEMGEGARVRFRVTVDVGATGTLENQIQVSAAGLSGEPVRTFASSPPGGGSGPTPLPVDACLAHADCGGATPACLVAATPNACVECTANAFCGGATPICDLSRNACVGLTSLAPAAQEKATVAGIAAPFPMTLTSRASAGDTFDLELGAGCLWPLELRSGAGTLVARRDGAGAWTIAPGGDTNSNGRPDLGPTPGGGGTSRLSLWITPPAGAPHRSACTVAVTARGAASGLTADASATLRTGPAASWTPDHTGPDAKAVERGGAVGFPGVIENDTAGALSFDLSAVVTTAPAAGPLEPWVVYSDPDGDGDPADGAPIAATGPVDAYGGKVHVVLVLRAATALGRPLPNGTLISATATAAAGAVTAAQASEARVGHAATYSDPDRTVARGRFAPCDAVYLGVALLPSGFPYAVEWYASASPVRGVDVPVRAVDPWPVSGGAATDSLVLPADAAGPWTVLVVRKTSPETVLGSVAFEVERAGAFTSLAVPARIGVQDGLSVSAALRNDASVSPYVASQLSYEVTDGVRYMDGTGAFDFAPATAHLTASITVPPGATAADSWSLATPSWPGPGLYRVDAAWRLQCGPAATIASATADFEVIPAPPAVADPDGLVSTRTPAISGTGIPGAAVRVAVGATGCGPIPVTPGGAWSCPPAAPLPDGEYVATAVQTVGGATSDPSAPRAFRVDATPPAVAIGAPAAGAHLGPAASPGRTVAFSGTAEAGLAVTLAAGGRSATAARAGASWSATLAFDVDGAYTAVASATDAAGNLGVAELPFTIDHLEPLAPVIRFPADGSKIGSPCFSGTFLTVAGTAEPGAAVAVAMGGETRIADRTGDRWTATFEPGEGEVTVTAIATDLAGNRSLEASATFTVDLQAPGAATITYPLDGATLAEAEAPGGSFTMEGELTAPLDPEAAVSVLVDGRMHAATVSGSTWSLALTLPGGAHSASAFAVDPVGNAAAPATIDFWVEAPPSKGCGCGAAGGAGPAALVAVLLAGLAPRRRRARGG